MGGVDAGDGPRVDDGAAVTGPSEPTRRQRIAALLRESEWGFDELRRELELPVHVLAEDLAHIERSVRAAGERLRVEPARCPQCGFVLRPRTGRTLHPPSRCPCCRNERLTGPFLGIDRI